ncbi:MAG: cobalamin biosynthesis protein CobQ [Mastigocoleus sp.]
MKRKRGRPRKYKNKSYPTMEEQTQPLENNGEELQINSETDQFVLEDWGVELDGHPNQEEVQEHNCNNEEINSSSLLILDNDVPESSNHQLYVSNPEQTEHVEQELESDNNYLSDIIEISNSFESINNKESQVKPYTTIHIIDGERGGAGKSFVSKALIEYCNSINHDVIIFDADVSNQDIAKIYPGVKSIFFSDNEKLTQAADEIFDCAFDKSVIVNLPAQVYSKVTDWINKNSLIDLGEEHSIRFVKWFVCTGGIDSVNFFLQSLDDLGDRMTHVFVRNMGLCDEWEYVQQMSEFIDAANKYQFINIDFPKFPFWERNMIERLGISFSEALSHPDFKVISRQRVKNFLKQTQVVFSQTGLVI